MVRTRRQQLDGDARQYPKHLRRLWFVVRAAESELSIEAIAPRKHEARLCQS
jgi:hypothetical protein